MSYWFSIQYELKSKGRIIDSGQRVARSSSREISGAWAVRQSIENAAKEKDPTGNYECTVTAKEITFKAAKLICNENDWIIIYPLISYFVPKIFSLAGSNY